MLAAACVGIAILAAGRWPAVAVLFAFFLPSTLLSAFGRARKSALIDIGKHGPRDAWQVLANGGIAAVCALLALRFGPPLWAAFAGALAAASADTWGTEIGTLARGLPRSILTGKPMGTGLSGGITWQGSLATLAGAGVVAATGAWCGAAPFAAVLIGGCAGALADSLAGASLQALRWCPRCERACETDPHACGSSTALRRGAAWLGNDAVNALATLTGALVAGIFAVFL